LVIGRAHRDRLAHSTTSRTRRARCNRIISRSIESSFAALRPQFRRFFSRVCANPGAVCF
jgi:hypothetical protein